MFEIFTLAIIGCLVILPTIISMTNVLSSIRKGTNYRQKISILLKSAFIIAYIYCVWKVICDVSASDPWVVLQLPSDSPISLIRRQFRELSKLYHPDHNKGNEAQFETLQAAYLQLTGRVTPSRLQIALPKWLEESSNFNIIVAGYLLLLIFVLLGGASLLKFISSESTILEDPQISTNKKEEKDFQQENNEEEEEEEEEGEGEEDVSNLKKKPQFVVTTSNRWFHPYKQ